MTFEEVRDLLKQRFPMLMVDTVMELVPGQRILAVKNVTGNEIQFLGHFPERAVMPGTLIVEAIGQSASILFAKTTGTGTQPGEFLMLGSINNSIGFHSLRQDDGNRNAARRVPDAWLHQ